MSTTTATIPSNLRPWQTPRPHLTPHQRAVHRVAGVLGGFTDEELVRTYEALVKLHLPQIPRQTASGIRTRRKELVTMRQIHQSPLQGTTRAGGRCKKWEVHDG
jgi:hypothetical protein